MQNIYKKPKNKKVKKIAKPLINIVSILLMATGPFLMFLPGPQILSWIGFGLFIIYNKKTIDKIICKLPKPFQTAWAKLERSFKNWKTDICLKLKKVVYL